MELTIGLISALLGMALGYVGFLRNRDKDVAGRAAETAATNAKLDYIGQGVDQIRLDQKASDARLAQFDGRLISVEKDVQAISDRVDKIGGGRG